MKALYMKPYEAAEIIDTDELEETLGGPVDHLWPFEDAEEICMVVLADHEDLPPNRTFEECGTVRGPILFVGSHDDFDDLSDAEIHFLVGVHERDINGVVGLGVEWLPLRKLLMDEGQELFLCLPAQ